jgi:hypothetical protein
MLQIRVYPKLTIYSFLFFRKGVYNFKNPDDLDFTSMTEPSSSKIIRSSKKKGRAEIESDNENDKENAPTNRIARKNKKVR